jgi:cation transport ATPase
MVILGIVLAAAAVAVGIGVIAGNSSSASIEIFGKHVPGVQTDGQVFAAGVLVAFVFLIGMALAFLTMGRALRARREIRDLRDQHRESLSTLEMEKQQLQRELARARSAAGGPATTANDIPGARGGQRSDRDPVSTFFDRNE